MVITIGFHLTERNIYCKIAVYRYSFFSETQTSKGVKMDKYKKYVFLMLVVVCFSVFGFACGETTFNEVPWGDSLLTVNEVLEDTTSSKNIMIEAGLPVVYKTTTTYSFRQTLNDDFQNRTIKDEMTTTLSDWGSQNAVAKIDVVRYVDDVQVMSYTEHYVKYYSIAGEACRIYREENVIQEGQTITSLSRGDFSTVYNPFLTLLNQIIRDPSPAGVEINFDEEDILTYVSMVKEKVYNEDTYYLLSSDVEDLDILNNEFEENSDIFNQPSLFQLYNKNQDYVISFNCQYGLNAMDYLKHFSLSYDIERGSGVPQERETYLSVTMTTDLQSYGNSVEIPSQPENVDLYTVNDFKDCVGATNSFVVYRDKSSNQGEYNEYSVYKMADRYLFNVRRYNSLTLIGEEENYCAVRNANRYVIYQIDAENGEYIDVSNKINPLFLSFDYSGTLFSSDEQDGIYQFGSVEAYIEIAMQQNEVYSVKTQNSQPWYICEYGDGRPTDENFYDIEGLTFVEE